MKNTKQFKTDYRVASDRFPKLKEVFWSEKFASWVIGGQLDICDVAGEYWDTYDIKIIVPGTYPYCVPIVFEMSQKIPRDINRHIDPFGECCLDIEHRLLRMSRRGIRLVDFIEFKIYPYFANQLYFEADGRYSSGEYAHHFNGIVEFYQEELNIASHQEAIEVLDFILSGRIISRNDPCFCGRAKYKNCHIDTIDFLRSVGEERLNKDFLGFKELVGSKVVGLAARGTRQE